MAVTQLCLLSRIKIIIVAPEVAEDNVLKDNRVLCLIGHGVLTTGDWVPYPQMSTSLKKILLL